MIVLHLDDELVRERFPFCRSLSAPSARTTRRLAGKTGRLDQGFQLRGELFFFLSAEARAEPDMVQQSVAVEQSKKNRSHYSSFARVAESADDAIGGSKVLDLHHTSALA